jgi:hypothetical protein
MRFLVCTTEANPCPAEAQTWSSTAEILDPAQFGVTGAEIAKVASWGFGFVLLFFLLGYSCGAVLGLIRRV